MGKKVASKAPKTPRKGLSAFDAYYERVYGERWPELKAALLAPVQQVARVNPYADRAAVARAIVGLEPVPGLEGCYRPSGGAPLAVSPTDEAGLAVYYRLDPASVLCARALDVQAGDAVLDLCAAPGGKALILAEAMNGQGRMIANEISDARRSRLQRVLREHLPRSVRESVQVTGRDAGRWGLHEPDAYDRILLDAPCSGERHLLEDPAEMLSWSEARSKNLAVRQYSLLSSAFLAVRPGGRIVYSTCSISPLENDAVIAKLLKRRGDEVRVLAPDVSTGAKTEYGVSILPDQTGWGPIYFAILERV